MSTKDQLMSRAYELEKRTKLKEENVRFKLHSNTYIEYEWNYEELG